MPSTEIISLAPRRLPFRGQDNKPTPSKQLAENVEIPPAPTRPPQRKTPGWIKALIATGIGYIGLGQLTSLSNTPSTVQKETPFLNKMQPGFQIINSLSSHNIHMSYIDEENFQLTLGGHAFTFQAKDYQTVLKAALAIDEHYSFFKLRKTSPADIEKLLQHEIAFEKYQQMTPAKN